MYRIEDEDGELIYVCLEAEMATRLCRAHPRGRRVVTDEGVLISWIDVRDFTRMASYVGGGGGAPRGVEGAWVS